MTESTRGKQQEKTIKAWVKSSRDSVKRKQLVMERRGTAVNTQTEKEENGLGERTAVSSTSSDLVSRAPTFPESRFASDLSQVTTYTVASQTRPAIQTQPAVPVPKDRRMSPPSDAYEIAAREYIQREISTPLDNYVKKVPPKKSAKFKIGGVSVVVKHDIKSKKIEKTKGRTEFKIDWGFKKVGGEDKYPDYQSDRKSGKVTKIMGPIPKAQKLTIRTKYGTKANPEGPSAYGKGTTDADKEAGNTSLKYHEGSHGADYLQYLKDNPPPQFQGKVGMTKADYEKAMDDFNKQIEQYEKAMEEYSKERTDCVGDKADFCE